MPICNTGGGTESRMEDRKRLSYAAAILVFLSSLFLRLSVTATTYATPISDFSGYRGLARGWLDSGHFGREGALAYRTPGYPGFLALVFSVFGPDPQGAAMVQAFLGALTSGLLVLLAGYVLPWRGAVIAGLLHALSPTAIAYVPLLASENLAVVLVVSGVLCLAVSTERPAGCVSLCGSAAIFGILLLVRPAAVFFLPGWVFLVAYNVGARRWSLARPLLFLAVVGLVLLPWVVRNNRLGLGPFVLSTTGGMNLWMGNSDRARTGGWRPAALDRQQLGEAARNTLYLSAATDWIRCNPRAYLGLCAQRAWCLFGTEPDAMLARHFLTTYGDDLAVVGEYRAKRGGPPLSPDTATRAMLVKEHNLAYLRALRYLVAPLVLVGLLWSTRQWRRYSLVVLPALSYLLGLTLTYAESRSRELSDPLLIVPVAGLLQTLWYRISTGSCGPPAEPHQLAEGAR